MADNKNYSASKILIATGSDQAIPEVPGLKESGYITFKEAASFDSLPSSIFILGGGPVGCEFAQIYSSFGAKVTLAESFEKLLFREDIEVSELAQALFENQGVEVLLGTTVTRVEKIGGKKIISYQKDDKHHKVEVDELLVATGKKPSLDFAPEKAGIQIENGRLKTNQFLETNVSHIYAAGDVVGPYLFTHTAEYQSYVATRNAFSHRKIKADHSVVPRCVFIYPEVASVGLSEKEAKDKGIRIKVGLTATAQLGRSNTSDEFDGFVKIITNHDETIIGGSIVAPRAGEMIHELALAVKLKVKAKIIAEMIHAYPTFAEALKFAASTLESR